MNLQNLRDNYPKLISYMEDSGYSETYISRLRKEIERILSHEAAKDWSSYTDVYLEYEKTYHSPDYLRNKRTIIGAIEQFDLYGKYPDGRHRHELFPRGTYPFLSSEFKSVIDCYYLAEQKRGKKEATIYTESHNASTFLYALQMKGMDSLDKITEEAVLEIFHPPGSGLIRSCSYKKNISAVLKACIPFFPNGTCEKVLASLPALRETRKNIQYLTPEEIIKLKAVLMAEESPLTFRDRAIGLLALYTGLRCCDIAGLTLDSIDWQNDLIHIRQQKTEVPLDLPLSAVVGNAIYDYLTKERPESEYRETFLTQHHPYTRMKNRSLSNVSVSIMKEAGIRQELGSRKGFHIFRHHLATALLGNGIPQPVISRALGHTSPDSLDTYLSADFIHLKECALGIEVFPIHGEVFL